MIEIPFHNYFYSYFIPEWIMNDMNWYEGTELRFNIDTEEVIITEKDD